MNQKYNENIFHFRVCQDDWLLPRGTLFQPRETKVGEDHQFKGPPCPIPSLCSPNWTVAAVVRNRIPLEWSNLDLLLSGGKLQFAYLGRSVGRIDLHGNPIHFLGYFPPSPLEMLYKRTFMHNVAFILNF